MRASSPLRKATSIGVDGAIAIAAAAIATVAIANRMIGRSSNADHSQPRRSRAPNRLNRL